MKNLSIYDRLPYINEQNVAIETTYIYMNGISKGYLFGKEGEILTNESGQNRIATVPNFQSKLTRISSSPDIFNNENYLFIEWDRNANFDYEGLAVICDEVVYIKGVDKTGVDVGANEIRLFVERGVNGTRYIKNGTEVLYPENAIIRSVVNITYDSVSYSFEQRADVSSTNMFAPVVDTSRLMIDDDIFKWANYNPEGIYEMRRKNAVYIFSGVLDEAICDYVGFLDNFNIRTIDQKIEIMLKDKLSTIWNEDIISHTVYANMTIADFLSDFLDIPRNMIIYPLRKTNGVVYNEKLGLHTWTGSMYTDEDFFMVDVLSTKDFTTYSDLLSSAAQELFFRMNFDTYERLVIQSDVYISNKDETYDNNLTDNYATINEVDDIINLEQTTSNQVIINKISGDFIERNTFYDKEDFRLNHLVFDVFNTEDKSSSENTAFTEHFIYNPDTLDNRTSNSPYVEDIDGNKTYIQVAVIMNDVNYENRTTWYRWSVIKHTRTDSTHGTIDSVSWGWVFKDYADDFITYENAEDYIFTEKVKYHKNRKITNAQIMRYDANEVPEFSVIAQYSDKDEDGELIRNINIKVGADVENIAIGDYVMLTDGVHDFMGKISDKKYGLTTVKIPGDHIVETEESSIQTHDFKYTNKEMDAIVKILLSTGEEVTTYEFNKKDKSVKGTVSSNTPYKTYSVAEQVEKIVNSGDVVESTIYVEKDLALPFIGTYKGTLSISNRADILGEWEDEGAEVVHQDETSNPPNVGAIIQNEGIIGGYEYRWVVSSVVHVRNDYYTNFYRVNKRRQKRQVQDRYIYSGNITLNTYKYDINIYTEKHNEIEDEERISDSTITVMMGFDPDYTLNYFGRHLYLESQGYVGTIKDFQLFYVRNEYPYVWEYNRNDKTYSMEMPLFAGETREITGNFGGIDDAERKYAGIVDDIQSVYGTHFGKNEGSRDIHMLYSREYHQPIPLYVRSNKVQPSEDKFRYVTYDNRELNIKICAQIKKYKEIEDTPFIFESLMIEEDINSDFIANVSNMNFGGLEISTNRITSAYRYTNKEFGEIKTFNIEKDKSFIAQDWTEEDVENYHIESEYKIINEEDGLAYFISRVHADRVLLAMTPIEVYGKTALKVNSVHVKFNVGDVIVLDKSNKDDLDTKTIYTKYSDSRWIIKSIDRDYNGKLGEDIIYLDYEFPMGYNNKKPAINKYDFESTIILQEFGIKGNPYTEEIHKVHYEHTTSVDIYGERVYNGITGRFIKMSALNDALSYIIDGFAGTTMDTTKFIMPIEAMQRYDLELFDIVRLDERIYTGMNGQTGIVVGKKVEFNETDTKVEYTIFTIGRYESSGHASVNGSQNYEPVKIPVYNPDGNGSSENGSDLNNVSISKYDEKLGNVMLLQIASDNLSCKSGTTVKDSSVLKIKDISSYFDQTHDLDTKKYYANTLFEVGQELFIKVNAEFMYCKVLENTKTTQSYNDGENETICIGMIDSAVLQLVRRSCFETTSTSINEDDKIELYQITSMANADGAYTTAMIIGSKPNREYFEFSIADGIDITSSRGRFLINTNEDWHLQARKILYKYYDERIVNELTEAEVLDFLGHGVVQIGDSSGIYARAWQPFVNYDEGMRVSHDGNIYICILTHTSRDTWEETIGYWQYKSSELENAKYIRYSPVGGLELKGNVTIDSGSFKINSLQGSNNFMHLDANQGLFGIGTNGNTYIQNFDAAKGYFQLGNAETNNMLLFYGTDKDSKFLLKTTDIDVRSYAIGAKTEHSYIRINDLQQHIVLNQFGNNGSSKLQVGEYLEDLDVMSQGNHFIYSDVNGKSKVSMKVDNGFIGHEQSHIYFDDVVDMVIVQEWTFDDANARNSYFGVYDWANDTIIGGTSQGNSDLKMIISDAKMGVRRYILVGNVYQYFNFYTLEWNDEDLKMSSMIYLNNGSQQFGSNVKDTANEYGYSGFFLGYSTYNGLGDIGSGQYLKYDNNRFMIGNKISVYHGSNLIDLGNIISGSVDNNLGGTTVFNENIITIYGSDKNKYTEAMYSGNHIMINAKYAENIISSSNTIPSIINLNDVPGFQTDRLLKFISRDNPGYHFECKIVSIDVDGRTMEISKSFAYPGKYYVYIQDNAHTIAQIGDLRDTPDTGELIRLGNGISYDQEWDSYGNGLYLRSDNNGSYFKYDTLFGMNMLVEDGIIDFRNMSKNITANSKFLKIESYTVNEPWDSTLHSKAILAEGWSSGYYAGAGNPAIGYHAHIEDGIGSVGNPCIIFPNLNSPYEGQQNRVQRITMTIPQTSTQDWVIGNRIKISWVQKATAKGKYIVTGLKDVNSSATHIITNAANEHKTTSIDQWEYVEVTRTLGVDLAGIQLELFFERNDLIEGSMYIDNIKVENLTLANSTTGKVINQLFFDGSNNSFLSMNNEKVQVGLLKNIDSIEIAPGNNLAKYNGDMGMFLRGNDISKGFLAYSDTHGLTLSGSVLLSTGNFIEDELGNIESDMTDKIENGLNQVQNSIITSDIMPSNVIVISGGTCKKYDFNTLTWVEKVVSTNKDDVNSIYYDGSKYQAYNAYDKTWITCYLVENPADINTVMPVKDSTIWISTLDGNSMYVYSDNYTFSSSSNVDRLYNGTEIKQIFNLTRFGKSDSRITITFASQLVENLLFTMNGFNVLNPIKNDYGYTFELSHNMVKTKNNVLIITEQNGASFSLHLDTLKVESIGLKKWNTLSNKVAEDSSTTASGKATTFIIGEKPEYKNKKQLTGTVYVNVYRRNTIMGSNTLFKSEINNGDYIFIDDKQYIVDKVISDVEIKLVVPFEGVVQNNIAYIAVLNWETDIYYDEQAYMTYDNVIEVGDVIVYGGVEKRTDGSVVSYRLIASRIENDVIYVVKQICNDLYPYIFSIEDIRKAYNYDEDITLKRYDAVYVTNYYSEGQAALFIFHPRNSSLIKERSIMDMRLDSVTFDDFILSSTVNDKYIFIESSRSKLAFSDNPFMYDEIHIAKDGRFGRFMLGDYNSDHMFFDTAFGLDIKTSSSIDIASGGRLSISAGSLSMESGSTLTIGSQSKLNFSSGVVNFTSSEFLIAATNVSIDSTSSLHIRAGASVNIDTNAFSLITNGGTISLKNNTNELYFSNTENAETGSSRIILNSQSTSLDDSIVFQLGDKFAYRKDDYGGTLSLTNADITLYKDGSNNTITINADGIVCGDITPTYQSTRILDMLEKMPFWGTYSAMLYDQKLKSERLKMAKSNKINNKITLNSNMVNYIEIDADTIDDIIITNSPDNPTSFYSIDLKYDSVANKYYIEAMDVRGNIITGIDVDIAIYLK